MNDERIDLSVLDPSQDPQRWDRIIQSVTARAMEARRRRLTISYQLWTWSRPALAIAATVALAIWAGALASARNHSATVRENQEPAFVLAEWAVSSEPPSTSVILQVLGEHHGTK
jgi:hypothetical protein